MDKENVVDRRAESSGSDVAGIELLASRIEGMQVLAREDILSLDLVRSLDGLGLV
jgi:hypothetical protein